MTHDAFEPTNRRSIAFMDRLASSNEGSASLYILWGFFALASAVAAIAICFTPGADRRIASAMSTAPGPARIAMPIQANPEAEAAEIAMAARIRALEEQLGTITGSLPPPRPATAPAERGATPAATNTLPALPADSRPVRTTSIDMSPPEAAEEVSEGPLTRTMFAVDLGAESSMGALRIRWDNLKRHYPELASLSPRIAVRDDGGKIVLHLVAGPFENAADAARACASLLSRGAFCDGGLFEGQRLPAT